MSTKLAINLHKLARFTNTAIPILATIFFLAGRYISFYYHFLTVPLLGLLLVNLYYLFGQKNHSLLRNFGILGQGRYMLESLGPELRQYLFSGDTEERPFNRTERGEVYRKANNVDSAASFGSQNNFDATEIKLRHSLFPISRGDVEPYRMTFGEERGIQNAYTLTVPIIISGMSYGALGKRAVRSLARGIAQTGGLMNTGEGGYPKYHLMENCDLAFQIGTAKFGVRNRDGTLNDQLLAELAAKEQIKMIELKLSQGAKPGKGGMLPKEKITQEISELRGVPMGRDIVSPTHHAECQDYPSTIAFIRRIQEISQLPVGIKLCIGDPRQFFELVGEMKRQDAFPDFITIDGAEGGTGAAPKAFLDRVGMPLFPALKSANDILLAAGVRQRVKIIASGKLISPGSQIIAFCLGANAVATARGFMLSIGCIQALQCGSNTCPVGITTHDPDLERGINIPDKALRVANYIHSLEHDLDELLCSAGARTVSDLTFDHLYIPNESALYPFANHS
ncbi:FMN-binding glutamate synthase family protein [Pelagicoccus mobilis]|uniref:FMN-binding glutamate synthase family protein n=1 Tax=Pelagicoccus mobilis TaxID=415221 RepID=A0A934VQ83_9BACT|nr:FMN-binding glutamate synthase family protein [Pelagicoccus mobilis]MBK1878077.1 FMN-binding glutamate synthase family protein [Pelagicoccus mobilis]